MSFHILYLQHIGRQPDRCYLFVRHSWVHTVPCPYPRSYIYLLTVHLSLASLSRCIDPRGPRLATSIARFVRGEEEEEEEEGEKEKEQEEEE